MGVITDNMHLVATENGKQTPSLLAFLGTLVSDTPRY